MSKHEKKTSSLLHYPVLVVFSLFFIGLFALDMVTPDRSYSELENTTLSQRPALTQFTAKGLNSYLPPTPNTSRIRWRGATSGSACRAWWRPPCCKSSRTAASCWARST